MVKYIWTAKDTRIHFLFNLLKLHLKLAQITTQVNKYLIYTQSYRRVFHKVTVINWCFIPKIRDVGMKLRSLKDKGDSSFRPYSKFREGFSNINDHVKFALQKWITVIQFTITH